MTEMTVWDSIKSLYEKNFNIPGYVLEHYSNMEILRRCVSGYSNLRISYSIGDDIKYVKEALLCSLGFEGWEIDLDFSPIALYNRCKGDYERYRQDVLMVSCITPDSAIEISFLLCDRYKDIERDINKYVI